MKRTLAVLLLGVSTFAALAAPDAPPKKYAVMSLIGDAFTIVTNNRQIGSKVDTNNRDSFPLPAPLVDQPALIAVDDALQKVDPDLSAALLGTSSPFLREQQSQLVANGHLVHADEIDAAIRKTGADRLILLTKRRDQTNLQLEQETIGQGSVYGIGFYLDRYRVLRDGDTKEVAPGYIAPFAYFNVYVIDTATSSVLAVRGITASRVLTNVLNKTSSDPWDILSPEDKVKTLNDMVREQILATVPEMLR